MKSQRRGAFKKKRSEETSRNWSLAQATDIRQQATKTLPEYWGVRKGHTDGGRVSICRASCHGISTIGCLMPGEEMVGEVVDTSAVDFKRQPSPLDIARW